MEQHILREELIDQLIQAEDLDQFTSLLECGHERGPVKVAIDHESCAGFVKLHEQLMDLTRRVPVRAAKLYTVYSGTCPSTNEAVFNGGNLYRTDWEPLRALLAGLGEAGVWDRLQNELKTRGHCYRGGSDQANRHGHSNDLPSYYAFGCLSLESYHQMVDERTWEKYTLDHAECCGVPEYLAGMQAAALE